MVLVDTSVWIRFLANRVPYAAELDRLLDLEEVSAHELVYGELLIGDCGSRQTFLASYQRMYRATTIAHGEVVEFVRRRALQGRGVGWIDIQLLASALVDQHKVWTADANFHTVAEELGVVYQAAG